jgi:5-methylcytosine-specific restriction endonuclease McrA
VHARILSQTLGGAPTVTSSEKKMCLELCGVAEVVAAAYPSVHAVELMRQADALKARIIRKQKRIEHVAKADLRSTKKAEKRKAHREETADIRAQAMERCGGNCESCRRPFTDYNPAEMDHLESGNGVRRQQQRIENVMMVCRNCHRARHQHPKTAAMKVRAFLKRHSYPIPQRWAR